MSKIRRISPVSALTVKASISKIRAFCGVSVSAATKPALRRDTLSSITRPLPAREAWITATPALTASFSAPSCAGAGGAGREAVGYDPFRAGLDGGFDQRRVGAGVGGNDIDARQVGHAEHIEFRIGRAQSDGFAIVFDRIGIGITQNAEIAGNEGLHTIVGRFGDVAGGVDFIVQHDGHTHAAGRGAGGDTHCVQQVQPAIGAERGGRAHGADDDDRDGGFHGQVQEIRGFFQRRRAVRDDDSGQCRIGRGGAMDQVQQLQPDGRVKLRACDVFVEHGNDLGDLRQFRHEADQLVDFHEAAGGAVFVEVQSILADAGDRAAGSDDGDLG